MPELKFLDSVHECSSYVVSIRGNIGVGRQVAHQPQQSREPRDAGVCVTGGNRFLYRREQLPVIFARQLRVRLKRRMTRR